MTEDAEVRESVEEIMARAMRCMDILQKSIELESGIEAALGEEYIPVNRLVTKVRLGLMLSRLAKSVFDQFGGKEWQVYTTLYDSSIAE